MVFVLSGDVHSGKTSLLKKVLPLLGEGGLRVTGYLSEPLRQGRRTLGYDLVEIGGGRFPFLRMGAPDDKQKVGPFFIEPKGLRQAERIIRRASPGSLLIVDEIGPLELEGKGVRPALETALRKKAGPVLLVIRRPLVAELVASLGLESPTVIRASGTDAARKLARILLKAKDVSA